MIWALDTNVLIRYITQDDRRPKTVCKIKPLQENKVIQLDEFLNFLEENKTDKLYKKILEHRSDIIRNYKLMQLHSVDIPASHKLFVLDKFNEQINLINKNEFIQIMTADKGYNYIKDPIVFLNTFNQLNQFALTTNNS